MSPKPILVSRSYAQDTCAWGPFPGEQLCAVESGIGDPVQNTLLFDHVQKAVVRFS